MRLHSLVAVLCLTMSSALSAQSITNGSLTGPITNDGVPSGWTKLLGSPDVMDQNSNTGTPGFNGFGATPSPSPNGGTWVGLGREGTFFIERFGQTVTGFNVGQTYTVSWFVSNFGVLDFGYTSPNQIEVLLNGSAIGTGELRSLSTGWAAQSLSFVAPASTLELAFQLGSTNKSYLGIDGIALSTVTTVVPEPGSMLLLLTGLGLLLLTLRYRTVSVTRASPTAPDALVARSTTV